jgi:hypothetical protein
MGVPMPVACAEPAVTASVRVPAGARAQVSVPLGGVAAPRVTINGEEVVRQGEPVSPYVSIAEGRVAFKAVPGDYVIEVHRE